MGTNPTSALRGRASTKLLPALLLLGSALLVPLSPDGTAHALIVADSALDICAAAADPCSITQEVDVVDGATLDFGLRAVSVSGAGILDFGSGSGTVLCGAFSAVGSGIVVSARGHAASGGTAGGAVQILARRRCSANVSLPCFVDDDCSSAGAGACNAGSGAMLLAGKVLGNADEAARLSLKAAGDLQVQKLVSVAGTLVVSDGGSLELESTQGSVSVTDKLELTAGGQGNGGDLTVTAAADVTLAAVIDADGGDYDGGTVTIAAGGDVSISGDILANSVGGAGFGGAIDVNAGGDLTILGGGASNRLNLGTEGHQSSENMGGDGGTQSYEAGGSIRVSRYVQMDSNGAPPDGFGDSIAFLAGADLVLDGGVVSKAKGSLGGGGSVDMLAGGDIDVTATALIDVTGFGAGGGDVSIEPEGSFVLDGDIEAGGSSAGVAGRVMVQTGADAVLNGSIATSGGASSFTHGQLRVEGCRVRVAGRLTNTAASGENVLIGHERITVSVGAGVTATGTAGSNKLRYRAATKPPVLQGTLSPSPSLVVDASLPGCPVCGNAEIDQTETCDDGGLVGGDGCSSACQDEGCVADTPNYPVTPLCDDASQCTMDTCNTTSHRCQHSAGDCSDGVACTNDSCSGNLCLHAPQPSLCTDTDPCTQDLCSTSVGCIHAASSGACDDGIFCNGSDTCVGGTCSGHSGDPCAAGGECADTCNEGADSCLASSATPCADDANVCTDDRCDGAGTCAHTNNASPCDDGLFCNGADLCQGGSCSGHGGDPCLSGTECRRVCREEADSCLQAAGSPCGDDGNLCTDDVCDAAGLCTHGANAASCDDLDFCTTDDACVEGQCLATAAPPLLVSSWKASLRRGSDNDGLLFKGSLPLAALTVSPRDVDVRVVVTDLLGAAVYDAAVPAGAFVEAGGGSVFRFQTSSSAGAGGIRKALLKKVAAAGVVRVRFKVDGVDLSAVAGEPGLALALLFGATPGEVPCVSAPDLRCKGTATRLSCTSP